MSTEENVRHEIEDLWWFRHCIEALVSSAEASGSIRVGSLRAVLETTRPLTNTTDPRTTPRETDEMPEEGDQ